MTTNEPKQFQYLDRDDYLSAQIARSRQKFGYCKVYFEDVWRYREFIQTDKRRRGASSIKPAPILCLGVRSGAEVDIFRDIFLAPLMTLGLVRKWIVQRDQSKYAFDKLSLARSVSLGAGKPGDGRVQGVELNPDVDRPDVFVGSFDELPNEWSGRFQLVFSNSFDHSQDPHKTISEWKRVAAPGAYLIIAFPPENKPTQTDPLGHLTLDTLRRYVQADVVFATETLNRTGYHEICFRLPGNNL